MRTIYVVKTDELEDKDLEQLFDTVENRGFFAERNVMESRPDFQQIIPSFVIRDREAQKILVYQRKPKHTEQRLAGMWTPIFGGHIDPEDWDRVTTNTWVEAKNIKIPPIVYNGLVREMVEETGIKLDNNNLEFFSLITDKSNPVGKVHTGVLFLLDTKITQELKEQILDKHEIHDVMVVSRSEFPALLKSEEYTLESWARLVFEDFIKCPEC